MAGPRKPEPRACWLWRREAPPPQLWRSRRVRRYVVVDWLAVARRQRPQLAAVRRHVWPALWSPSASRSSSSKILFFLWRARRRRGRPWPAAGDSPPQATARRRRARRRRQPAALLCSPMGGRVKPFCPRQFSPFVPTFPFFLFFLLFSSCIPGTRGGGGASGSRFHPLPFEIQTKTNSIAAPRGFHLPLGSNHRQYVGHRQSSYCCVATLSCWDDDAITALWRTYHAPHRPSVSHPTLGECHMLNLAAAPLHQKKP